jgi:hypothetical membrane protein
MTRTTTPRAPILNTSVVAPAQQARTLLACGAAAGPLYVITGLIEGLTRSGFNLRHQDLSLLSNGPLGWIHITLFLVTGSLLILGAAGTRHVLGRGGRGATWGPRLLATYGVGLLAAGLFVADPMSGFPSGTPAGRPTHVSWHGNLHFISAAIAFLAFIVACFVFARRFSAHGQTGWARFSVITGVLFVAAFLGVATGSSSPGIVVSFGLAVVLAFTWITLTSLKLRNEIAAT